MAKNRFTIVNIGSLSVNKYWGETERMREPSATCTLVETGDARMLVDPSPFPGGLESRLFAATGLRPSAVDLVYMTHFHGDHRFGLALFEGVPWLMASSAREELRASKDGGALGGRVEDAEGRLPDGVDLFPSPGHTPGHCSLALNIEWGRLVIAGDAVMTPEFWLHDDGFHNTWDFDAVRDTIGRIRAEADFVVPGHGNYFPTAHGS